VAVEGEGPHHVGEVAWHEKRHRLGTAPFQLVGHPGARLLEVVGPENGGHAPHDDEGVLSEGYALEPGAHQVQLEEVSRLKPLHGGLGLVGLIEGFRVGPSREGLEAEAEAFAPLRLDRLGEGLSLAASAGLFGEKGHPAGELKEGVFLLSGNRADLPPLPVGGREGPDQGALPSSSWSAARARSAP